jgi:hypothetical protein
MNLSNFSLRRRESEQRAVEFQLRVTRVSRAKWIVAATALVIGLYVPALIAELIPSSRLAPWIPGVTVGVPGGIPTNRTQIIDVTQAPYGADKTGATNAQPAVQAAVNAATDGQVVYLPAGRYRFDTTVSTGYKDNITIRGAGPEKTVIDYRGVTGSAILVGGTINWQWNWPDNMSITGSPKKGATVLTVGDTSSFKGTEGRILHITLENDSSIPVASVSGFPRMRTMKTRIVAVGANTLTVSPGIYFDLPSSLAPKFAIAGHQADYTGIEDLKIDAANSSTPHGLAGIQEGVGCWLKNVEVANVPNYQFGLGDALLCEMRHCKGSGRKGNGTNGSGLLMGASSGCLVEDNIIVDIFPSLEINAGCTGNVFAYNFVAGSESFGVIGCSINSNHGSHNSYNLYEGNVAPRFQCDGYFGGASEETLFRNWIHGTSDKTTQYQVCINLNRFSRTYTIVGNLLGRTKAGVSWKYTNTGPEWTTTSSTPVAISPALIGVVNGDSILTPLTLANPFKAANVNTFVRAYSAADPSKYIEGRVWTTTGSTIQVIVDQVNGSGTVSDWVVSAGNGFDWSEAYCIVMGLPNIGNGGFTGLVQPSAGEWWSAWRGEAMVRRGTYNSGTAYNHASGSRDVVSYYDGVYLEWIANNPTKNGSANWSVPSKGNSDWLPISANAFQEFDLDVGATTIIKGNWNARDKAIPAAEALGETLPASLYRSAAPAWFGTLSWPAFNPSNPAQSFEVIPAGYRYYHPGEEAPGVTDVTPGTPDQAPSNVRIRVIAGS